MTSDSILYVMQFNGISFCHILSTMIFNLNRYLNTPILPSYFRLYKTFFITFRYEVLHRLVNNKITFFIYINKKIIDKNADSCQTVNFLLESNIYLAQKQNALLSWSLWSVFLREFKTSNALGMHKKIGMFEYLGLFTMFIINYVTS